MKKIKLWELEKKNEIVQFHPMISAPEKKTIKKANN